MTVSVHFYRWLMAAHTFYGQRANVSGFTLMRASLQAQGGGRVSVSYEHSVFMYQLVGTWGFGTKHVNASEQQVRLHL